MRGTAAGPRGDKTQLRDTCGTQPTGSARAPADAVGSKTRHRITGLPLPQGAGTRLVGLVVKASASRAEDPGFESRLHRDLFFWGEEGRGRGSSHASDLKVGTPVATCQAPGVIGSVLGLVGEVSVYCEWVRRKVWSTTSISVWQHVKLLEQISP